LLHPLSPCSSLQSSRKLLPLFDRILIRRVLPQNKTAGGIILPEGAQTKLNEVQTEAQRQRKGEDASKHAKNRDG
jgi:co-chaperonin GroES (HSP10)